MKKEKLSFKNFLIIPWLKPEFICRQGNGFWVVEFDGEIFHQSIIRGEEFEIETVFYPFNWVMFAYKDIFLKLIIKQECEEKKFVDVLDFLKSLEELKFDERFVRKIRTWFRGSFFSIPPYARGKNETKTD